jgi:hypothetical protein
MLGCTYILHAGCDLSVSGFGVYNTHNETGVPPYLQTLTVIFKFIYYQ